VTRGLPYELFLGLRYLGSRGKRTNLSLFVWIGVGGVFLGVAALILVLAVMTGFQDSIRDKIIDHARKCAGGGLQHHPTAHAEVVLKRPLSWPFNLALQRGPGH